MKSHHRIGPLAAVDLDDLTIRVRYGPMFRADIPRSAVAAARVVTPSRWQGIGVRMVRGGWLVNTRFGPAVELRFHQPQRAHVFGVPVHPRRLLVAVEYPDGLVADLGL